MVTVECAAARAMRVAAHQHDGQGQADCQHRRPEQDELRGAGRTVAHGVEPARLTAEVDVKRHVEHDGQQC